MAVPIYIPTNSVRGFPFLHSFSSICCLYIFWWWPSWVVWGNILSLTVVMWYICIWKQGDFFPKLRLPQLISAVGIWDSSVWFCSFCIAGKADSSPFRERRVDVLKTERYSGTQSEMRRVRRASREPWQASIMKLRGGRRAGRELWTVSITKLRGGRRTGREPC